MCHTVDPFAQTALLVDAHRSGTLDWFEVSASATLSTLGPLSILLLLSMPWRSYSFGSAGPTLSRSPEDAGVGQVTALDVGLGDS